MITPVHDYYKNTTQSGDMTWAVGSMTGKGHMRYICNTTTLLYYKKDSITTFNSTSQDQIHPYPKHDPPNPNQQVT